VERFAVSTNKLIDGLTYCLF